MITIPADGLEIIVVRLYLVLLNGSIRIVQRMLFREAAPDPSRVLRILVLRTAGLGDFIISIPALAALRRKYPGACIKLITASTADAKHAARVAAYAGGSITLPWLSFVVPSQIDDAIVFSGNNPRQLVDELKPIIRTFDPDISVILSDPSARLAGVLKKLVFLRAIGVRTTVYGAKLRATRRFFLHAQYRKDMFVHHVVGLMRAVAEMPKGNSTALEIDFPLALSTNAEQWAEQLWLDRNLKDKCVIALSPGSIQPHKRWPIDKFIALAQRLATQANVHLLIIGTENDRPFGSALVDATGDLATDLTGSTSVATAASLLRRCALLIGNDGGAMHLASAVGCNAISITPGIEFPDSIEPWRSRQLAVRHPVSCAPCYCLTHCPKGHNRCMTDLPLEAVLSRSLEALKAVQP